MKLFSVLALAATALSGVVAQNIHIGYPLQGGDVTRGQNVTVEVDKPNSLTGSTSVGIAIALRACSTLPGGCANDDPTQVMGNVLYSGPFNPQYSPPGSSTGWKPPHQNFTVYIPPSLQQGEAMLSVAHFVLIGAGPWPVLDITNYTVNLV